MKSSESELHKLAATLRVYSKAPYRREFPWREDQTPYRVLLSELMLQQTQVERVKEKFVLFTTKYPSLADIRYTPFGVLLSDWKGLGYMRRLKFLRAISEMVDRLPYSHQDLPKLPGVGEYTKGALLAFAYNEFSPIIETNIRTMLCVHFCVKGDVCAARAYKEILPDLFKESGLSPRHFYEACMDYGASLKKEKVRVCELVVKQGVFKGSKRELRAKTLFAILHNELLPKDDSRFEEVVEDLVKEGFVKKTTKGYEIAQ